MRLKEVLMPVLKEKLGEKGYEELESFIVEKIKLHSVERDEFREVLSRLSIGLSTGGTPT